MEKLRLRSNQRIERTSLIYQRDESTKIDWTVRLLGIKGARGIGKTTLLLLTSGIIKSVIKSLSGYSAYFIKPSLLKS